VLAAPLLAQTLAKKPSHVTDGSAPDDSLGAAVGVDRQPEALEDAATGEGGRRHGLDQEDDHRHCAKKVTRDLEHHWHLVGHGTRRG
jgi:hypothetical protein